MLSENKQPHITRSVSMKITKWPTNGLSINTTRLSDPFVSTYHSVTVPLRLSISVPELLKTFHTYRIKCLTKVFSKNLWLRSFLTLIYYIILLGILWKVFIAGIDLRIILTKFIICVFALSMSMMDSYYLKLDAILLAEKRRQILIARNFI